MDRTVRREREREKMGESVVEEKKGGAAAPEVEHPQKALGWAARDTSGFLSPFRFSRRATGDNDVKLKILFCGICHSDLHNVKNDWRGTVYPVVPGHEIVGVVTEVGTKVEKFNVGDRAGVGCLVGSCGSCSSCDKSFENHCAKWVLTYGSVDKDDTMTYGGYSDIIVAPERFVVRFPENLPLDRGAPLLCAGVTVYSPMKHFGLNEPGKHLGVVGLGGLGHVAIRFAKAFGAKVTVISTSPGKEREAIDNFGADSFLLSSSSHQMKAAAGTLDGIIDAVSAVHALGPLFGLLKSEGTLILVGAPEKPLDIGAFSLIRGGKKLAGSCVGGMRDTQEMLDFAAKHGITADVEVVPIDYVNTAMERLARNDVRFRFVIDVGNTLKADE